MRSHKRQPPRFVIRDGAADCYDLRLEIDGVLASWAVPKDRRMARRTGDHPLEHSAGEGAGEGAGDGAVVDRGTYANTTDYAMAECLERGHLSFHLRGARVHSRYTLTRVREGHDETWLLMRRKEPDEAS